MMHTLYHFKDLLMGRSEAMGLNSFFCFVKRTYCQYVSQICTFINIDKCCLQSWLEKLLFVSSHS